MSTPPLAVADLGNTALKVVLFGPRGRVLEALRIPLAGGGPASLRRRLSGLPRPAVVVSVNERHLALLQRALGGPRLPLLGRDLPLDIVTAVDRPEETGADRLCAAAAAFHRARGPVVAVGLGTAVTVDAVDDDGRFLGGSIGPGLRAAAEGLAAAAPRLPVPDLEADRDLTFPGTTTARALRAGFLLGWAGAVDRLAAEASRIAGAGEGPHPPVLLHGGDAPLLLPWLKTRTIHAPHLVAEGARLLWMRARG